MLMLDWSDSPACNRSVSGLRTPIQDYAAFVCRRLCVGMQLGERGQPSVGWALIAPDSVDSTPLTLNAIQSLMRLYIRNIQIPPFRVLGNYHYMAVNARKTASSGNRKAYYIKIIIHENLFSPTVPAIESDSAKVIYYL